MSINISLSPVQFISSFFGRHEALLNSGRCPTGQPKFQILSIPRPWFLTSNVSGSGTNVLNDQSKPIIRIYYDDQLKSFVDVDRSNGAFKTSQKPFIKLQDLMFIPYPMIIT